MKPYIIMSLVSGAQACTISTGNAIDRYCWLACISHCSDSLALDPGAADATTF